MASGDLGIQQEYDMDKNRKILEKIIEWANGNENIRCLIMEGSIAQDSADELSDIDISIFSKDVKLLTQDDSWIAKIAKVWVYSPDKRNFNNSIINTRLVIYEGGVKVDYSLWSTDLINELVGSDNSKKFDTGYKILLDKDGLLVNLPQPSSKYKVPTKPTEEEFIFIVKEFWFEAYHVAKYLKREDLWLVKSRDWAIKELLLRMMEWYTLAKNNWNIDVKWMGKNIKRWLEPGVYNRVNNVFGHFDLEDSWEALISTNNLFRDISKDTAIILGYSYPEDVDKSLSKFIVSLKV